MPSETMVQAALKAVSAQATVFRSAVAAAANEVGARLNAQRNPGDGRVARTAAGLGTFGARWVDPERFSALIGDTEVLDPASLARVERAYETLTRISRFGEEAFTIDVPPGGDLRAFVGFALGERGAAFAAAREAELARLGRPEGSPDASLTAYPPRDWHRAERQIAPPLVVLVDGGDAQASGLAEFLDGTQKIVLVLRGTAPPTVLTRLITPGVTVVQASEPAELEALTTAEGPAIAALVPKGCALFVHRAGPAPVWERLEIGHLPEPARRSAIGSFTAFQQEQELGLLADFAAAPLAVEAIPPVGDATSSGSGGTAGAAAAAPDPAAAAATSGPVPAAPASTDPADRLAAWLLSQSGIGDAR